MNAIFLTAMFFLSELALDYWQVEFHKKVNHYLGYTLRGGGFILTWILSGFLGAMFFLGVYVALFNIATGIMFNLDKDHPLKYWAFVGTTSKLDKATHIIFGRATVPMANSVYFGLGATITSLYWSTQQWVDLFHEIFN